MDTALKGTAAEAAVLSALVSRGFPVLTPFGQGHPYDLVLQLTSTRFLRIQCKAARRRKGCLVFNPCTTDRGRGRLPYIGLADLFGVHYAPTRAVFLVPVQDAPAFSCSLRLDPAQNNQKRGTRLAADYEMDRWTAERFAALTIMPAAEAGVARPEPNVASAA
jgi:PD-(D/E)XK nuclease superfamily protein